MGIMAQTWNDRRRKRSPEIEERIEQNGDAKGGTDLKPEDPIGQIAGKQVEISVGCEVGREIVEGSDQPEVPLLDLSDCEIQVLLEMIENPPAPNEKLKEAAQHYQCMFARLRPVIIKSSA